MRRGIDRVADNTRRLVDLAQDGGLAFA
jgi:hypothetical protein